MRTRVRGAARRISRTRAVRRPGPLASRFAKQALPPSMEHGSGAHGAPPFFVAQMRAAQRQAWRAPGSTSTCGITACLHGVALHWPAGLSMDGPIVVNAATP
eukprot:1322883-Pyramimonas_sp.AAC.1